jgi:hypothetical protein
LFRFAQQQQPGYQTKQHNNVPGCFDGCDKELTAVGIGSTIGHGQVHWTFMFESEIFIGKFFTINTFATATIKIGEVSTLDHKIRNNTVKD